MSKGCCYTFMPTWDHKSGKSSKVFFAFTGDLNQMGVINRILRNADFPIERRDVYPGTFDEEVYKRALSYLFTHRVNGWWNQEAKLLSYGICTQIEFDKALGRLLSPCHEARIVTFQGIGFCIECGQYLTRINQETNVEEWLDGYEPDTKEALRPVYKKS